MTSEWTAAVADTSFCYRRRIACFSGPSSLIFSAKSAILELKGGKNENFTLCMMFRKVISLINEKNYFGDRVPLSIFERPWHFVKYNWNSLKAHLKDPLYFCIIYLPKDTLDTFFKCFNPNWTIWTIWAGGIIIAPNFVFLMGVAIFLKGFRYAYKWLKSNRWGL